MDKTDRLRDYGLAFLLYEQGLGICGYELIRELFIFIKLILNSYLWIMVLFNIVSIKGNCAEQRLFENNGYVNRGKLAFAYHFSLSKIYRHQVCLGYSQQPLGRNSTSQINTMRSTICKYLCLLPSKVASCHR